MDYGRIVEKWRVLLESVCDCRSERYMTAYEDRICPKCGKAMVLCEDEKTYYQIWECDGCGYKEDE